MGDADSPSTGWIDETPKLYRVSESVKPPLPLSDPQSCVVPADHDQAASTTVQRETQARPLESQILASKCLISESEITAIVRQVLEGIEYLRRQGRVLATLSADAIQLTQSGSIKIGNRDRNSYEITAAEMDAATLKLLSLAEIVERLMKKNPPPFRWSAEVESLPSQLRSLPLEELSQVSVARIASCSQLTEQSGFLRRSRDEGELVMIVGVVNKTVYHRVDSFSDRS
ncbi:uncharacterized protein N7482_007990 [Penicillium canariense]|uniref:Uncharacterized protein n=1 Tax=Penicillium canariense TaxID=189055 RepID=A0A9W9I0E9_9EURO|nr:uncharacterized protein N7482_007990 [Penicillium canariense]KAJ5160986.1 hypothetical protein N7482_007990 [Penicillium canariense]